MKNIIIKYSIAFLLILLATFACFYLIYAFVPLGMFGSGGLRLGSTITTINSSDTLRDSRSVINTNFSNLNTDKLELSDWYATTSVSQFSNISLRSGGYLSIGTSSPYVNLAISGNAYADTFRATTSASASTFPYASTTVLSVGQSSYLGTVKSGTWNGSSIGGTYGGTGQTVVFTGSTLYGASTNVWGATTTLYVAGSGNIGIGSTTPTVPLQITNQNTNATTTVEVGKLGQSKGSCLKMYNQVGTLTYCYVVGTTFTCSTTSCE